MEIEQYSMWNVDLGRPFGSEQGGKRPCIVITTSQANIHGNTVIILPMTSRVKRFNLTHVRTKLKTDSFILCEQIRTIDKNRLGEYIGMADAKLIMAVKQTMRLTLDL